MGVPRSRPPRCRATHPPSARASGGEPAGFGRLVIQSREELPPDRLGEAKEIVRFLAGCVGIGPGVVIRANANPRGLGGTSVLREARVDEGFALTRLEPGERDAEALDAHPVDRSLAAVDVDSVDHRVGPLQPSAISYLLARSGFTADVLPPRPRCNRHKPYNPSYSSSEGASTHAPTDQAAADVGAIRCDSVGLSRSPLVRRFHLLPERERTRTLVALSLSATWRSAPPRRSVVPVPGSAWAARSSPAAVSLGTRGRGPPLNRA